MMLLHDGAAASYVYISGQIKPNICITMHSLRDAYKRKNGSVYAERIDTHLMQNIALRADHLIDDHVIGRLIINAQDEVVSMSFAVGGLQAAQPYAAARKRSWPALCHIE